MAWLLPVLAKLLSLFGGPTWTGGLGESSKGFVAPINSHYWFKVTNLQVLKTEVDFYFFIFSSFWSLSVEQTFGQVGEKIKRHFLCVHFLPIKRLFCFVVISRRWPSRSTKNPFLGSLNKYAGIIWLESCFDARRRSHQITNGISLAIVVNQFWLPNMSAGIARMQYAT